MKGPDGARVRVYAARDRRSLGAGRARGSPRSLGRNGEREIGLGSQAVLDSDAAATRGDFATAIARARDAAEAAAPGSPYPRDGYARLEAIARDAEAKRDERRAVAAWGAMRAAATAATNAPLSPRRTAPASARRRRLGAGRVRRGRARPVRYTPERGRPARSTRRSRSCARRPGGRSPRRWVPSPCSAAGALAAFFVGCGRLLFAGQDVAALRRERVALLATVVGALLYAVACIRG